MIFDTIAALADFSDLDFDGDVTADQIVDKLIELRNQGLLHTNFENLNIGGVKRSNAETQEWKHFIRDLLAQKRTNFSEVEADMIAERVYRTRMYEEGNEVREDLASSSSSSAIQSSSSSSSSSSISYSGAQPSVLMTATWGDADVTKTFFGLTWANGETKLFEPDVYLHDAANEDWRWTDTTQLVYPERTAQTSWGITWKLRFSADEALKLKKFNVYSWAWASDQFSTTSHPSFWGYHRWNVEARNVNSVANPGANQTRISGLTPTSAAFYDTATPYGWQTITDNMFCTFTTTGNINGGITILVQRGPNGSSGIWKTLSSSSSSSSSSCSSSSSSSSSQLNPNDPNPSMLVTVSWTGPEENKTLFGQSFTNGESKLLGPTYYLSNANSEGWYWATGKTTQHPTIKLWRSDAAGFWAEIKVLNSNATDVNAFHLYRTGDDTAQSQKNYTGIASTSGLYNATQLGTNNGTFLNAGQFGSITTTDGTTIQWQQGPGAWGSEA